MNATSPLPSSRRQQLKVVVFAALMVVGLVVVTMLQVRAGSPDEGTDMDTMCLAAHVGFDCR